MRLALGRKTFSEGEGFMAPLSHLRLIQFRAGYNLPVHAAIEYGIFAKYGLEIEVAYTPGSDYLIEALRSGKFEIGHPAADDVVAAGAREEDKHRRDNAIFIFLWIPYGRLTLN